MVLVFFCGIPNKSSNFIKVFRTVNEAKKYANEYLDIEFNEWKQDEYSSKEKYRLLWETQKVENSWYRIEEWEV